MERTANICIGLLGFFLILQILLRVVRRRYKFPIPHFLLGLIDNPIRRRLMPPYETAVRMGVMPGMRVLEIGPGKGTYTLGVAERVGPGGSVYTVDIVPEVIKQLQKRIRMQAVGNIDARVATVYDLPFPDGEFDLVYMIAVIGEIPQPLPALRELHRLLKPSGLLVMSELFVDPDYSTSKRLLELAGRAGFELKEQQGNFFYYTLLLQKQDKNRLRKGVPDRNGTSNCS